MTATKVSGRFDRQVVLDRPDLRGREKVLKVHVLVNEAALLKSTEA
jgi:ATP-dependent Zn protease